MKFNFKTKCKGSDHKSMILVVDDSAVTRHLIKTTLASVGIETKTVSDGEAAIAAIEQDEFDAMVTDLNMPRLTGAELIQKVREHSDPNIYKLPILVTSSISDEVQWARLRFLGADSFLPKPFNAKSLVQSANHLLSTV